MILLAALLWLPAAPSSAQTLVLTLDDPTPQYQGFFGSALAAIGDVDGDGVPDLAVAAVSQDVGGNPDQGQVFVFSGATGDLLRTLDDPTPHGFAEFGHAIAGVGDIDGDTVTDLAVGAPRQNVGGASRQGQVFVFSGATGALLLTLDSPSPQGLAEFGASLAGVGDVDGDAVPDLAVGAFRQRVAGNYEQGQVFVFSGATGAPLLTLDDPTPQVSCLFGLSVAGIGDVDGDTVPDLAVGAYRQDVGGILNQGQAFVFSGATGVLLHTLDDPAPHRNTGFGVDVAGTGDLDGDGTPDLAVGAFLQNVVEFEQGRVFVFSGATGALLLTLDVPDPQVGGRFGSPIAGVEDLNGDGVPDLAVGAASQDVGGNVAQGQAFVFSGSTGALLITLDNPKRQSVAGFGGSLAALGDVNGDSVPDLAVGAGRQDVGTLNDQGRAFVFGLSPIRLGPRAAGFWKHQCSEEGFHQVGTQELAVLFDHVEARSSAFTECAPIGCEVLQGNPPQNQMRPKAERETLALWLNVVSGRLSTNVLIDIPQLTDATTVGEAIAEIEATLCDPQAKRSELETARDIAKALNRGGEDMELASAASSLTVEPGDTATLTLGLVNMSPSPRSYELETTSPWPVSLSQNLVSDLGSGQVAVITVSVQAPESVLGRSAEIHVTATGMTSEAGIQRDTAITIMVPEPGGDDRSTPMVKELE